MSSLSKLLSLFGRLLLLSLQWKIVYFFQNGLLAWYLLLQGFYLPSPIHSDLWQFYDRYISISLWSTLKFLLIVLSTGLFDLQEGQSGRHEKTTWSIDMGFYLRVVVEERLTPKCHIIRDRILLALFYILGCLSSFGASSNFTFFGRSLGAIIGNHINILIILRITISFVLTWTWIITSSVGMFATSSYHYPFLCCLSYWALAVGP